LTADTTGVDGAVVADAGDEHEAPRPTWTVRARPITRSFGPAILIVAAQQIFFPAPAGIVVRGLIVGGLTALIALGMALIYRANRILNFAQADLGLVPVMVTYMLLTEAGLPYLVAVPIGLAVAVLLGATTERLVIRRFARAPRLLVTIATVGLSQVLVAAALLIPRIWDQRPLIVEIEPPFHGTTEIGGVFFDVNDLLALIMTPLVVGLVAVFLQRSGVGVAIRASADNPGRAALLGIPVERLNALVWSLAAALAFVTVFLRAGVLGVPTAVGTTFAFGILLRSLVALVLGRLTDLPAVAASAVALGVLELGISWEHSPRLAEPVLGLIVLVVLVVRRREVTQIDVPEASAWKAAEEIRPVPRELARLPVVRNLRWLLVGLTVAVAAVLPHVLPVDRSLRGSALLIYAILGLSLVILSGWSGHISLGQVAFFAIGAALGGKASADWGANLFAALVLAAAAGALVAAVVGIPALRLRGLYFAVTTFALSLATTSYLLNDEFFDWVPRDRIPRPALLGRLEISSATQVFELALVVLVAMVFGLRGIRASRTGRALVALRDNERAAQAYSIDGVKTPLGAFALSGAIASLAGALFVHHQQSFDPSSYSAVENLSILTMVVVGGMSCPTGAVLGATFLLGTRWFLDPEWQILASGVGVLAILLLVPGGLASLVYRVRDWWLRRLARSRGLDVSAYVARSAAAASPGDAAGVPAASPIPASTVPPDAVGAATRRGGGAGVRAASPDSGERAMLDVSDLCVSYGGVQVLFGVDLTVRRGEAVALLGTNGAGKSTVLRAISGLVEVDNGRIRFDGRDITGRPAPAIAALGVAQMPGGSGVFPSLTVNENLRAAEWLVRRDRSALADGHAEVQRLFPVLTTLVDQQAANLSGGQQQMLALAMVFLGRPKLLMIDELSLGLAPIVVSRLLRLVEALREQGTTVVVVEQSVNVALAVTDRAVFLERGEVRFTGSAGDLLERSDLLRSVFLGTAGGSVGAHDPERGDVEPPAEGRADVRQSDMADADSEPTVSAARDMAVRPRPAADATIAAVGLTRAFGGVRAVQDVSFEVASGEIVGVIGPNGAGKTTLFDLLSGFVPVDEGRVLLRGSDVTRLRSHQRAAQGLGRSFQDARLFPGLTVDETIAAAMERWVAVRDPLSAAFHLPNAYDSERRVARRVDELVELLALGAYRSLFTVELSTGTRRVVDLACLLAHRPDVVLLDEPAAGIAQREVEALAPLVLRIRDETGASLVIVEHDIPLIEAVADRLVAMDQGRVIAVGPPRAVLADPEVIESYLGTEAAAVRRSGKV
jgi:ABC-type branched-subunit amino acid transport system ATPase component/ABC-type branched-subunit amino acid transport system permease subunit